MNPVVILFVLNVLHICSSVQLDGSKAVRQYPTYISPQALQPSMRYNYPPQPILPYPYTTYSQAIVNQPAFPITNPLIRDFFPYNSNTPYSNYPSDYLSQYYSANPFQPHPQQYDQQYPQYFPQPYPQQYPSYHQQYPQQQQSPFVDPLAYIPTEIIDIDVEGAELDSQLKLEWPVLLHSEGTYSGSPIQPIKFVQSSTATTKPIRIVATRIFENGSSEPKVNVTYSDSNSNPGSGILVDAANSDNEIVANKGSASTVVDTKKEEEQVESKPSSFSLFGF